MSTSLFRRRVLAWFVLAATGNITVLSLSFIAWQSPLHIPFDESLAFWHALADPMYAPSLLFFTSVLSMLSTLGGDRRSTEEEGNRLVARAVQVALTLVLSFATVMVVVDPMAIANVLFAILLGFTVYVLAEQIAPPRLLSTEAVYHQAEAARARRNEWASESLEQQWRHDVTQRVWPTIAVFLLAPVVVMTGLGTSIAWRLWGPEWALAPKTVFTFALCSLGAVCLVGSWYSAADKTDSPSARAWRSGMAILISLFASGPLAWAFFSAGKGAQALGWLILSITVLQAAALWLPIPWAGQRALQRVAATVTHRRMMKIDEFYFSAREKWNVEREAKRASGSLWERMLRRFGSAQ